LRLRFVFEIRIVLIIAALFAGASISVAQNRSVYTPLDTKNCRTVKAPNADEDDLLGRCRGVAGYALLISEGDLRQNLIVVTPKRTEHSLELWDVISGGFSTVGPKVEWRMAHQNGKLSPVALIIRYNANEDAEHPNKLMSYLAVAKITADEICVTDKISPGANANNAARRAADSAATKPCLKKQ
jgi:hypothetical protein